MRRLLSGWMHRYALAVRAAAALLLAATASVTVLADGNRCCGQPGAAHCSAQGCADDSYCVDRIMELIAACCGTGDGEVFCLRTTPNSTTSGWCTMCNSGRTCGICPPLGGGGCNPSSQDLMNCSADGYSWDYGLCACNYSPIVIQLEARERYRFTDTANGVRFDVNGDGRHEQSAWTAPEERQAFLVLDRNGNGVVDSAAELFGNFTRLASGERAANGFEALVELEDASGVGNGVIDAADPVYHQLQLWVDANHNGVSEPNELSGLGSHGGCGRVDVVPEGQSLRRERELAGIPGLDSPAHGRWRSAQGDIRRLLPVDSERLSVGELRARTIGLRRPAKPDRYALGGGAAVTGPTCPPGAAAPAAPGRKRA
jgi:hypothetical protein